MTKTILVIAAISLLGCVNDPEVEMDKPLFKPTPSLVEVDSIPGMPIQTFRSNVIK